MDEKTLKKKTVAELRAMAKKESLPLRSKMVKAELIALILGKAGATKGGVKRAGQLKRAVQVKKEAPRKATAPMAEPMTEAMLKKKTIAELRQLAKARSIPLRSTLRKTDLVRLLLEKDGSKKKEDRIEAPMPRAEVRPTPTAEPYADIPAGYGVNRIAAMARDPAWIYAYWEITPDGLAEGKRRVEDGEAKLTLRVGDLTEGTERASSFDVEIYHRIGNWYIEVGRGGRTFVVEIGMKSSAGAFAALARSNPTTTPTGRVSDDLSEEWWVVEDGESVVALDAGERLTIQEATREELAASSGWLAKPSSK